MCVDHQEEGVPPHVRFHLFHVREDEATSSTSTCDIDIDDPVATALLYLSSLYTISLSYLCLLTRYLGSCEYSSLFSWISPTAPSRLVQFLYLLPYSLCGSITP